MAFKGATVFFSGHRFFQGKKQIPSDIIKAFFTCSPIRSPAEGRVKETSMVVPVICFASEKISGYLRDKIQLSISFLLCRPCVC